MTMVLTNNFLITVGLTDERKDGLKVE